MSQLIWLSYASKYADFAPLVLRLAVGAIFFMHGYQKLMLMGIPGVTGMLASMGFPAPAFFAVVLIAVELIGGIMLVLGAFTRLAAKLTAIVAFVALVMVHLPKGFFLGTGGYEYILLILAVSSVLVIMGGGKWSVDRAIFKK